MYKFPEICAGNYAVSVDTFHSILYNKLIIIIMGIIMHIAVRGEKNSE